MGVGSKSGLGQGLRRSSTKLDWMIDKGRTRVKMPIRTVMIPKNCDRDGLGEGAVGVGVAVRMSMRVRVGRMFGGEARFTCRVL